MGFRAVEVPREQLVLWSHRLDDAVAPDHPVRLFERILGGQAFAEFFKGCQQDYVLVEGRRPFNPRDIVSLYLYGMLHGIRSSRRLEAACYNRIDVIWLMQGQTPDHSTIAGFVADHGDRLRELFRQSVRVAVCARLVKMSHHAVDGTKLEADAGKGSVKSKAGLEAEKAKLAQAAREEEVESMVDACEAEWSQNEQKEQSLWADQTPEQKPANEKEAKAARRRFEKKQAQIDAALAAIEKRRQEAQATGGGTPREVASKTDPDARVIPDKQGRSRPGYNAQVVVDSEQGVIVAQEVNDRPEDMGQMTPMLEQVRETIGRLPEECSADSGYNNGSELKKLQEMGVTGYLPDSGRNSAASHGAPTPAQAKTAAALEAARQGQALTAEQLAALPHDGRGKFDKSAFIYDAEKDQYRCPAGHSLPVLRQSQSQKKYGTAQRLQYGGIEACATCPHASQCCGNPAKGRTVNRDQFEGFRQQMRDRMHSEAGAARYRLRAQTVEPRFGFIKHVLGIRRFMRRGLQKFQTEFAMICTAVNLKVLMREATKAQAAS